MATRARQARRAIAWMTAAIVVAVSAVVAAVALAPTPSVAQPPAAGAVAVAAQTLQPASVAGPTQPPSAAAATPAASTRVRTRSARLEDVFGQRPPAPVGLDVDAIAIAAAPVDPVGVEPGGSMEIPTDISRVGWYEYGPAPGDDEGTAVLTAHVDSRIQGKGVFYDLDALRPGDAVDVVMDDGTSRAFVVDEVRQIPKVDLPTGELFRRDGEPRLALITCGGDFDPSSRHYRDNLVVLATPAR